jgi:trimeric autotransporter adhesin
MKDLKSKVVVLLFCTVCLRTGAHAQLTPSADAYTNTADPTTNYGAKTLLDVESASQTAYIRFDLSAIPAGYTSANISKASLKLYVNSVTTAGSFNVDYVNGTWSENTITANLAPALGTTIAVGVSLTVADKNQYILIDITSAVQAWLSGTANDGIALVGNSPVNAIFDSKENTTTSHSAELDIVFAEGSGGGGITGITTAGGSGLTGGGTSGALSLSLTKTCAAKQVLQWSGSAWACASPSGSGTVTSIGSGPGLTGGPITGTGTLGIATAGVSNAMLANPSLTISPGTALTGGGAVALGASATMSLDTTKVPLLAASNTFSTNQTINGTLTATSSVNTIVGNSTGTGTVAVTGSGVYGGVLGLSSTRSTTGYGVKGWAESTSGVGLEGVSVATTGTTYGVYGDGASTSGFGVYGRSPYIGVYGAASGPSGQLVGGGAGVWGDTGGVSSDFGVLGTATDNIAGGFVNAAAGHPTLYANNSASSFGDELFFGYILPLDSRAIIGDPGCNVGFMALQLGQDGMSECSNYTLTGGSNGHTYINAVTGAAVHLRISNVDQLVATSGNVSITGNLNATGSKNFRIDHPLDPANKYLFHAAIESSEVLNLYSGNVALDASGEALVQLPDWFEVINKDFRYQLTPIGAPGRDLYIAEEVSAGHFKIAGGKPGGKVSWQVSGVRNDAWEKAHPMEVEADKGADRGHYLTPEIVGAPETARIGYTAPAPGSGQVVHHRPAMPKRDSASPLQQRPPSIPVPAMPVAPRVGPMAVKVNQK